MSLILAAVLVSSAPGQFAEMRRANAEYCRQLNQGAACVERQNRAMGSFATTWAAFTSKAEAKRCMERGKRGKHIDWPIATTCLRTVANGRSIGHPN